MRISRAHLLAVLLVVAPAGVRAQDGASGTLVGTVTDQAGNPLAGVRIGAASETQIGGPRVAYSAPGGSFRIVGLTPGLFELTATAPRLKTVVQKGLRVGVDAATDVALVTIPGAVFLIPDEAPQQTAAVIADALATAR